MGEKSTIEWTDHTFNPWIGCTKVSPGCKNCYAETLVNRYKWAEWGPGKERKRTSDANWKKPLSWNRKASETGKRTRVFCASLADWLDQEVPTDWRVDLMLLISRTPFLEWLMLTKRPEELSRQWVCGGLPRNIVLGVSAENQIEWDRRVPIVKDFARGSLRTFVSAEPLIGPIKMRDQRPDWLIVGGESGPGARPMESDWVTSLRDQCDERTAFFFKQWGPKRSAGRLSNNYCLN